MDPLAAWMPDDVGTWASEKRAGFDDPEFRGLYLAYDRGVRLGAGRPAVGSNSRPTRSLSWWRCTHGKEPNEAGVMIMNDREALILLTSHWLAVAGLTRLEELANAEIERLAQEDDPE